MRHTISGRRAAFRPRLWPGALLAILGIAACSGGGENFVIEGDGRSAFDTRQETFEGPVPRASCGPGSIPEPPDVFQGQIPAEEPGYRCNVEIIGEEGVNSSWQLATFDDCAYYNQDFAAYGFPNYKPPPEPGFASDPDSYGTVVLDVTDPTSPVRTTTLRSPAMLDPHESLKAHEGRALLAAVAGYDPVGNGPAFFDVYDVSGDCTDPLLTASVPVNLPTGHEGNFAADGNTYYGTSLGTMTAIDVADPTLPLPLFTTPVGVHGLSTSDDGNRAYLAVLAPENGLQILDVSDIQSREPTPEAPLVGQVYWTDGATAQMTIPVTIDGTPYVIFADEGGFGSVRIIDISEETQPFIASKLKLEVHMPGNNEEANTEVNNNAHYCSVPRRHEPGVVACTFRGGSGMRLFDIRNVYRPKELAYINWPGSYMGTPVHLIPERSEAWFTDQHKGFFAVRFTNGVWPFAD